MPKIPRRKALNPYHFHSQLTTKLLSITELANSWEQLGLLAEVADLFYSNIDPQYQELYEQFQNSARRLAALAPAGHHFDQGNHPAASDQGDQGDERDRHIRKMQTVFDNDRFTSRKVR